MLSRQSIPLACVLTVLLAVWLPPALAQHHTNESELAAQLDDARALVRAELPTSASQRLTGEVEQAIHLLQTYPELASRELALALLEAPRLPLDHWLMTCTHTSALEILISLREVSIRPVLRERAISGGLDARRQALHGLAMLGDAADLPLLEALATGEHPLENPDRAADLCRAARRAARDLRLYRRGMVVPFDLADLHVERLLDQGFTVLPEAGDELYALLEPEYPFVTSDVVWRTYMLLMRLSWEELEQLHILPRVRDLCRDLAAAAAQYATELDDPHLRDLAWTTAARIQVAHTLLSPGAQPHLPPEYQQQVQTTVRAIMAAEGVRDLPLHDKSEDLASYHPNGHYARSAALRCWFRALVWLGRTTWHIDTTAGVQQTLLLADLLHRHPQLRDGWFEVDRLLDGWVGPSDDITLVQLSRAVPRPGEAMADPGKTAAAARSLRARPAPRINSLPRVWSRGEGRGVRLLGQRRTATAEAMQKALDAGIWPPSCPEIIEAALASATVSVRPSGLPTLPTAGLSCLQGLSDPPPQVPPFMTTGIWRQKQRNTCLAGWAELDHLLAPYTKTAHTIMGISMLDDRFHGYVEPSLVFYERLAALVEATVASLDRCGFFEALETLAPADRYGAEADYEDHERALRGDPPPDPLEKRFICGDPLSTLPDRAHWQDLALLLDQLQDLARRELAGEPQTRADALLLRQLPMRLQWLALNQCNVISPAETMGFVTTVAVDRAVTDQVLQLAVGRPLTALVAVPDGAGRTYVCRGPIYTVYEMLRPADQRLDDAGWREVDRFPRAGAPEPWLMTLPELAWHRTMGRDELLGLTRPNPRAADVWVSRRGIASWRADFQCVAGVTVPDELATDLADVATAPTTPPGLRMYLLEQMLSMTGRVILADHWRQALDLAEAVLADPPRDDPEMVPAMVAYWALQAVDHCGDLVLADRAEDLLARLPEQNQRWIVEALAAVD